jgi:hypothetical protein
MKKAENKRPMVIKISSVNLNTELILPEFQVNRLAKNLAKEYRRLAGCNSNMIRFEFKKI